MRYKIITVLVLLFLFTSCAKVSNDVDFARFCFNGLTNGNLRIAKSFDWSSLVVLGMDIGKAYGSLPNEVERKKYIKAFIKSFSFGWRTSEGSIKKFGNWRILSSDVDTTVVAADYDIPPRFITQTLLFTIMQKRGEKKLIKIEWMK